MVGHMVNWNVLERFYLQSQVRQSVSANWHLFLLRDAIRNHVCGGNGTITNR